MGWPQNGNRKSCKGCIYNRPLTFEGSGQQRYAYIAMIPVSLEVARRRSVISELQANKRGLNNYGRIYKRS